MGPCRHGMSRPRDVDKDMVFTYRVAVRKPNKPTNSDPPAWGLGGGLTTHRLENQHVTKR
jgi:hypothetical protein